MFNMSRDAMLCLTITKTLKEALYKKAENKRMKIGDIIDLILFESVNTYQNTLFLLHHYVLFKREQDALLCTRE